MNTRSNSPTGSPITRRTFLKSGAVVTAGLAALSPLARAQVNKNSKLRIFQIGVGGIGSLQRGGLKGHPQVEWAGFCDVDRRELDKIKKEQPNAWTLSDYREAFANKVADFDAVIVDVPDFHHAPAMLTAMKHNKHIYGQKPLVHQLSELKMIRDGLAARPNLITQMGNQRSCNRGRMLSVEILRANQLGRPVEAYVWTGGVSRGHYFADPWSAYPAAQPVPEYLNWDLWRGPLDHEMPYSEDLSPRRWRAFWETGGGQLADWGCHLLDLLYFAYDLPSPEAVITHTPRPSNTGHTAHNESTITYAGGGKFAREKFVVHYNDDALLPSFAALNLPPLKPGANHTMVVCEEGTLLLQADGMPQIFRKGKEAEDEPLPKIGKRDHWKDWADNCLGDKKPLWTPFQIGWRITEPALLAVKATRFPGQELRWDAANFRFTNHDKANQEILSRNYPRRLRAAVSGLNCMQVRELTLRGLVLGALITTVFTAANVYLGLKVGLTFASSIPAAVISMALLSLVRNSSILENNIVQTVASAAGTLSAIIFVLPGLVIVGWWTGFPFWQSFLICVSGGILGVLFTIPLRRALVTHSDLPYPEGVAAAEVLKVGSGARGEGKESPRAAREGLIAVILGSAASASLAVVSATQIAAAEVSGFFRITATAASGYSISWSLALFGAGHLVGLAVGLAMLTGLLIAWAVAVPILTYLQPTPEGIDFAKHAGDIWRHQVRFIGAGAIGVSAIWTLAKLARPVVGGLITAVSSSRARSVSDDLDRDLSPRWIIALTVACLAVAGGLSYTFARSTTLATHAVMLTAIAVPFVFIVGFLIAGVCGYMAGLIGASNSPISGVGILAIVICASILTVVMPPAAESRLALVAFALFVTAIVFACATISNDNLQDLKTGQLVGASPWRQQVALIVGVGAGAAVIPSVLNLLAKAYGFAGAPNLAVVSQHPLPAPQATLISALAQGVIGGNLDWKMIGVGVIIGVCLIALDGVLNLTKRMSLPPLAVGIGIYLPMSATFAVVVGAVVGHWYNKRAKRTSEPERAERLGTLVASGLIVGESLFGVLNAGLIVAFSNDAPMALVSATFAPAKALGLLGFVGLVVFLYGWMSKMKPN